MTVRTQDHQVGQASLDWACDVKGNGMVYLGKARTAVTVRLLEVEGADLTCEPIMSARDFLDLIAAELGIALARDTAAL
nr:hypothetical protein [Lentzea indica]